MPGRQRRVRVAALPTLPFARGVAVLWCILIGAIIVLLGAPSSKPEPPRPGPTWFDILATLEPTGRQRRRARW